MCLRAFHVVYPGLTPNMPYGPSNPPGMIPKSKILPDVAPQKSESKSVKIMLVDCLTKYIPIQPFFYVCNYLLFYLFSF